MARAIFPDGPSMRLVTILAPGFQPGRMDPARMGQRNPADTEARPPVPAEGIEATRAELAALRRRMTHRTT